MNDQATEQFYEIVLSSPSAAANLISAFQDLVTKPEVMARQRPGNVIEVLSPPLGQMVGSNASPRLFFNNAAMELLQASGLPTPASERKLARADIPAPAATVVRC